jgi:hypothetical protein
MEREPMLALEVVAASAIFRILPREVLDMILWPMPGTLFMDPDSPVAVNASDTGRRLAG